MCNNCNKSFGGSLMFELVNLFTAKVKGIEKYFIDNTKYWDDEPWYQRIEWDKSTNKFELTDDYWSGNSLPQIKKVSKVYCHLKKKIILCHETQKLSH